MDWLSNQHRGVLLPVWPAPYISESAFAFNEQMRNKNDQNNVSVRNFDGVHEKQPTVRLIKFWSRPNELVAVFDVQPQFEA